MDTYTFSPEAIYMDLRQDGRPVEIHMEESIEVCFQMSWYDTTLNHVFLTGLDDDLLVPIMLPDADEYPLEDFRNRVF
ncbi:MAG: hypothetical protein ACRC9V_04390 [Aeromonas sp.]